MKPLRILYIGPIPPEVGGIASGGIAIHCWDLALQARKKGYDVYILGNSSVSGEMNGIHVMENNVNNLFGVLKAIKVLRYWRKYKYIFSIIHLFKPKELLSLFYIGVSLDDFAKTIRPNVIHIHSLLECSIYSGLFVDNLAPIVVTDHGIGVVCNNNFDESVWSITWARLTERISRAVNLVQYIIVVSEFAKESLLSTFSINDKTMVSAILNPIDSEKWPMLEREKLKKELDLTGKKTLIFSGVHLPFEKKGLDILMEAVAYDEWLCANCNLVIITTENAGKVAREYIRSKGITGVVIPPQPQAELPKYYNAGDVFVMPSRLEGIGLVYSEALISGTPVVGFYKSVQELERELGIYIGEGFNAATDGPKELAEKIKKVLSMDVDRQALRTAISEKLSWDVKFRDYDCIYRELVAKSK